MNELQVPEGIKDDPNAMEMIRVWIGNKDIQVSMLLGMWEEASNFEIDEREAWGEALKPLLTSFGRRSLNSNRCVSII